MTSLEIRIFSYYLKIRNLKLEISHPAGCDMAVSMSSVLNFSPGNLWR